jgi:hypothetical protein
VRHLRPRVRRVVTQLIRACGIALLAAFTLIAATPSPVPKPAAVNLTKAQPKALLPKVPLHSEYVVAVNKLGQVTHVVSGKPSKNKLYDLQTYGNALQAFIRTPDGSAISGTYRLIYDYSPKTARIRRNVELVREGGVDPNAEGAALMMIDDVRKHAPQAKPLAGEASATPAPRFTGKLPPLQQILKTPAP